MTQDVFLELVSTRVSSLGRPWEEGIASKGGESLPFALERAWSGASGNYIEQWSIRRGINEIVYESEPKYVFVRGLQSITKHVDRVEAPIAIEPGAYRLLFVVEGLLMGTTEIQVIPAGSAAA